MVRLSILGDVDLRAADGTVVGSVLSQPRRFALLVYLALEPRGVGVQRDRLLGVFWADLPQEKARQALRTALHFLRRSLGRASISSHGDLLALDPEQVSCDAAALRAALDAGRAEEALRLYEGELLPGFYLDGGPVEFERWLDETRAGLRRDAAEAAWSLAEARASEGNHAGAGAWARKAAELSQGDEAAVRRAITLLGRVGDRAGALVVYDELVRRLKTEFDAVPSPETEQAIARVRDRTEPVAPDGPGTAGEGAVGAGEAAGDGAAWAAGRTSAARAVADGPAPVPAKGRRRVRPLVSAAVSLILVFAFYSLWGLNRFEAAPFAAFDRRPVLQVEAIRDFSPDGSAADLAGVLTLELTGRLSETDAVRIVPVVTGDSAGSAAPSPTYILRSGLLRSDSMARVSAMLVDAASGATLERIVAERPLSDPARTADQLADDLGPIVRRKLGRAVDEFERRAGARDARALELVRGGLQDLDAGDSLRVAGASEAASVAFEAADSQLALAQAAAPRWPEPSVQRAELALHHIWLHLTPRQNDSVAVILERGLEHARTALSMRSDDPAALDVAGSIRYWQWLLAEQGGEDGRDVAREAEDYLRRATRIDPSLARAWDLLSVMEEMRGDFGAANLSARRAYRADAYLENAVNILLRLFTTSLEIGDLARAGESCHELGRRFTNPFPGGYCRLELMAWQADGAAVDPDSVRAAIDATVPPGPEGAHNRPFLELIGAVVLARAGLDEDAVALLEHARQEDARDITLPKYEAWALLALGRRDEAADLLARTAARYPSKAVRLLSSRRFESLRQDERIRPFLADS